MSVILDYPYWFIVFCILIGFSFASILYLKNKYIFHEQENPNLKKILFTLRFFSTTLLAFMLLSPLIKSKSTKEIKPTIVILQDNSASLKHVFKKTNSADYKNSILSIEKKLQDKHNVVIHTFGKEVLPFSDFDLKENQTNIELAIEQAHAMYEHQHIAAILLASDGIYNTGNNPIYLPLAISKPIYTIGLGDTTQQKDASIVSLSYPDVVYMGDNFEIQIDLAAQKLKGQNTILEVVDNQNKIILQKNISIQDDDFVYSTSVTSNANKSGILAYKVRLKLISGELIKENNFDVAYIDVIDGRQKILLLYDVPHPDVKAIRQTLEQGKNYQVDVIQSNVWNKNFDAYDLLILHGVPSNQNMIASNTLQQMASSSKPIWYILAAHSNLQLLNSIQNNIQINGSAENGNDVQTIYHPNFSKFILDETLLKTTAQLPPLLAPYGKYSTNSSADILFYQKLGNVATQNPLFSFYDVQGKKTAILAGEGIWRWKLNEYEMYKNFNATDDLINKTIQFLTVKTDKQKFKISSNKKIYENNESIRIDAQLYNESFVLVNEPEVNIKIIDEQQKMYNFSMDKTLNAYTLNAGALPEGNYTVVGKTNYKGKNYERSLQFSVRSVAIEYTQTQANFSLLKNLSAQSGGKFYGIKELQNIVDDIEKDESIKTILHEETKTTPLIDWKVWFAIIVLLLSAEWFIRKYNGIA